MVMGKKVWAICRGAVRWDFELYSTLAMLCDYRSKGLIEGIVISTWKGEVDKLPNLRQKLKDLNIYLVELNPLDESAEKFININYARQAYQLKSGLDFVPDDVFILSCRTDFTETIIKSFEDILLGKKDLSIGNHGGLNIRLNYKIAVMCFSVDRLWGCIDRGFLGYKADLYKMTNFQMTEQKYGLKLYPDISFFVNIFMDYPLVEEFLNAGMLNNKSRIELLFKKLKVCLEDDTLRQEFELPEMLNKMYALYFILLKECFCTPYLTEKLHSFDIIDIFTGNRDIGMFSTNFASLRFRNSEILRMIVEGECKQTQAYTKLLREIWKMAQPGYAEKLHFIRQDYIEMAKWIKNFLKLNPDRILISPDEIGQIKQPDTNFKQALKILFSNCDIEDNRKNDFYTMMYDICFNKRREFYAAIVDNFKLIHDMGQTLVEMTLPSSVRTLNPKALKICAKGIYYGTIHPARLETAQYNFRKNSHKAHFYSFPLLPDHISALYYYGKYAEPLGENDVPKAFYTKLMQTFQLSERPAPDTYADAILELIKEIVNSSYQEYEENLSVRYLIDFLIDENLIDILTEEASGFLKKHILERRYVFPFQHGNPNAFLHLLDAASEIEEESASYIIKLILMEKSGQPANMKIKAQKIVNSLAEKYSLRNCWFIRTSNLKYNGKIEINKTEITDNNDFLLLVKILADKKCLRKNNDIILNLCSKDPVRHTIFYVLLRKEFDTRIQIFGMKNGKEIWMNYTDFMNTGYDKKLVLTEDKSGLVWPQAESASKSSYAMYIRIKENNIVFSIEFNSRMNSAKEKLLENIECVDLLHFDISSNLIRLCKDKISFDSNALDTLQRAVNQALDKFCEIGDMLTASAIQLNETS